MYAKLAVLAGRLFRGGKATKFLGGIGKRMTSIFSRTAKSNASRGSVIMRSAYRNSRKAITTAQDKFKSSLVGKAYYRLPAGARSIISGVGSALSIDAAIDWIWSDEGEEGSTLKDADGKDVSAEQLAAAIAVRNGHVHLLDLSHAIEGQNNVMSNTITGSHKRLVEDMMTEAHIVLTGIPGTEVQRRLDALTDKERSIMIARLICIAKNVCLSSQTPNLQHLFLLQSAASDNINAAPTEGLYSIFESNLDVRMDADDKSIAFTELHNGLYDEYASASAEDFWSEKTSVLDWWDKSSNPDQIRAETTLLVSKLATDDVIGFDRNWFQRFVTDKDGKDDESMALRVINRYGVLADGYIDFMSRSADGQESASTYI